MTATHTITRRRRRCGGWWSWSRQADVLGRLANPGVVVFPALAHAWRTLVRSGGTASITALAADIGWSRQHLARRFGDEFGLSPKLAARVVRFERARRMLQSTPPSVTIAQAAACGYYGRAHLDRRSARSRRP